MATFVKVAEASAIPPGQSKFVMVEDAPVAIFNIDGKFYAIDDICSHAEASLSEGEVDGHTVACPKHGARFDVRTGEALCLPAWAPVNTYQVKVEGNDLLVSVESGE